MNASSDRGPVARGRATVMEDADLVLLAAMFPCFHIMPRVVLCLVVLLHHHGRDAIISFSMSYTH